MSDLHPRTPEWKKKTKGEERERKGWELETGVFSTHLRCPGSVLGLLVMKLLRGRGDTLGRG